MAHTDVAIDDLEQLGFASYRDYLISEYWRKIRVKVLGRDDWKCVYCGRPATNVKLLSYSLTVLKGELPEEMVSICNACYLL